MVSVEYSNSLFSIIKLSKKKKEKWLVSNIQILFPQLLNDREKQNGW